MTNGEFLKGKYWKREEFRKSVARSARREAGKIPPKPQEQINLYLQRLYKGLTGKELIRKTLPERFVRFIFHRIKKEYFFNPQEMGEDDLNNLLKNILLGNFAELRGYTLEQLRNPQIREEVIKQWEQENRQNFKIYQIPEEEKEKIIEQTIKDQEESLNYWFTYFLSPEAENYPLEFRYWAFAEMLKCGSYDEKRRTFNERTKSTIAPFPPLNQQALAIVLDEIIRKQKKGPSQILASLQDENERREFEKRLKSENFRDLYGFALDYVKRLVLPKERLPIIKGEWRVFKKGSDPKELVRAIQNFPTGWCIAGEGTAAFYLSHSDIYIYFSEDPNGNPTIPRAAIVYNPELQRITEVRGVAESQNLDPYIHPVVEEKLREIPGGIEWMETMQDQKKLAEIYLKYLNNQELTQEELRFIYEIDREIEIFGYRRDPRIEEILRSRDKRKDLSIILNCREDEIAMYENEITDNTRVIYMPQETLRLKELPTNLEYAFCSLNLKNTPIKSLGKLKRVGKNLDLSNSQIEDLGDLEEVRLNLYLNNTPIKSLGKLKRVGRNLDLYYSQIEDLGDLEEVRGSLGLSNTPIKSLGKLKRLGGSLDLYYSQIEDLGDLEEVRGSLGLNNTPIKSLGKLKRVGEYLHLSNSKIEDLGDLEEVRLDLYLNNTPIKSLGKLKRVGRNLDLYYSKIEDLGDLEEVRGVLYLSNTPIKSLGKLKRIGDHLDLSKSQIEDLGDLEEVGLDLYLNDTPIKSLGKLKRVGRDLYLSYSQIEDLGDLEEVGGFIYIYRGQKNLEEILIKKGWGDKIRYVDFI
jgi:hypothetical protein